MTNCLYIASLQYHLLVDIRHVWEVLEIDINNVTIMHDCRFWRGNSLRVHDLRRMLGELKPSPARIGVVYGENESDQPVMLLCDKVFGIVHHNESARLSLPHESGQITDIVDSVLPDPATGQLLYHVRQGVFGAS